MSQVPPTRMTKVKGKKEPLNVKFFLKKSQLNVWSDECGKLTVFFCLILCQCKNKTVPSNVPNFKTSFHVIRNFLFLKSAILITENKIPWK